MKKVICLITLAFLISSAVCFAQGNELRFSPSYLIPGDTDLWDRAFGLEAQYIIWNTPNLGFAFSGGIGYWQIDAYTQEFYDYDIAIKVDGSALTFPLGASVLYRPIVGDSAVITLESGLRYVIVESDADITATAESYIIKDKVGLDNGLVGLIGADIAFPVSPAMKFGFGGGYQFDIYRGDATWHGSNLGDNELKGFFLRLGVDVKM